MLEGVCGEDAVEQDVEGPVATGAAVPGDERGAEREDVRVPGRVHGGDLRGERGQRGGFLRLGLGAAEFDGHRGGEEQEQVDAPGRGPAGHAAFVEQCQDGVDQGQVVRAAGLRGHRHPGDPGVAHQQLPVAGQQFLHPIPPGAGPGGRRPEFAEKHVEDLRVQVFGVPDVDVERRVPRVERGGDTAHRHLLQAFVPQDAERGVDDPLPGQGRFRRPLTAAGGCLGVVGGGHDATVARPWS